MRGVDDMAAPDISVAGGALKRDLFQGVSTAGAVVTEGFAALSASFRGYAFGLDVGTDIAPNAPIVAVRFPDMTVAAGVVTLRLKVFTRPLISGGVANPALNNAIDFATDTLVGTYDYSTDAIGLTTAGTPNAASEVRLVLPIPIPAATIQGQCVYFVRQGVTAGGASLGNIGAGRAIASDYAIPLRKRGWNQSNTSVTAPTWSAFSARRLAVTVETQQWINGDDYAELVSGLAGTRASAADRINQSLDADGNLRNAFNAPSLRIYRMMRRALTRPGAPGQAAFTASIASNGVMTVSAVASGVLGKRSFIYGADNEGLTRRSVISSQLSGTPGGVGTYQVYPQGQTVSSRDMIANAGKNVMSLSSTSWMQNRERGPEGFALSLIAEQGDGGGGWTGAGFVTAGTVPYVAGGSQPGSINGNVRSTYGITYIGTWTSTDYAAVPTPDTGCATSSTAGDQVRFTAPDTPVLNGVDLFWVGTASGVIRYSWDNASWTTLNVQGTIGDCSFAALAGFPTSGAVTLYVEVVSGTCKIGGVNWKSAAAGAVVHKLGCGGHSAAELAVQAIKPSWQAAMARLGITTAHISHGTNDQAAAGVGPYTFETNYQVIAGAIKTAIPSADIVLATEAENDRATNLTAMVALSAAAARAARSGNYGFLDLQWYFGDPADPTVYQAPVNGGTVPLFNEGDVFHPEPVSGGLVIEQVLLTYYNDTI